MIDNDSIEYSLESVLNWMSQAAQALEYIQNINYNESIHIKPSKMLLDEKYQTLKICKFGIGTVMDKEEIPKTDWYREVSKTKEL